ncbi:hypothetical protein Q6348_15495 [Isoptericola sp. b441]|uniref:Mucin-2 n=1 Tax=Actinotalea lenta TaxID=3064654 RepID=A0ABT9DCK3_9CELL|nr:MULTISPECIES: hypothetical protein [unclassified Isoptericola]MDO8108602.1 hypothetical protein [Isoptericola sp. b441]MDO8120012.1 hypothetical protein [Isoptericola sp. b490]
MRIYLPATVTELGDPDGLVARVVHAVTPALRAALPDEDEEGLEFAAQLLAADDSLDLLGERPDAPLRRVVVAADVPQEAVAPLADDDAAPSAVRLLTAVPWSDVACAHVDEVAAAEDVTAALAGDEDAADRLADRDLLWFDVGELARLAAGHE